MTSTPEVFDRLTMFGAEWCRDCRRSKALLEKLGVDYDYVDLEAEEDGADRAKAIRGDAWGSRSDWSGCPKP